MKTILLFLLISITCLGQVRIKSRQDIPTMNSDNAIALGKLLLKKRFNMSPDTINNKWEKYTVRKVNTSEQEFYAADFYINLEKGTPYYWDSVSYRKNHLEMLLLELFNTAQKENSSVECWSYNLDFKLTPVEMTNLLRSTEEHDLYEHLMLHTSEGDKPIDLYNPPDLGAVETFFVVEKTIITKDHKIIHQLLAIAPHFVTYDPESGVPRWRKLLCWFILPQ